jgi:uncharacterized membrane protein
MFHEDGMQLNISLKKERGNISFLAITVVLLISFIFAVIFDLCQIYVAREQTKNLSDGIALALAQDILFFDRDRFEYARKDFLNDAGLKVVDCAITYDKVQVSAEKKMNLVLLDRMMPSLGTIRSVSLAEVIFPWDRSLGNCDYYKFDYRY